MVVAGTSVWVDPSGRARRRQFRRLRQRLLALPCFNLGGQELAVEAARNYRRLRRLGVTPRSDDVLIAMFCIDEGHELLQRP